MPTEDCFSAGLKLRVATIPTWKGALEGSKISQIDPDADTNLKLTADWTTHGAEDTANRYLTADHRVELLQFFIDGIKLGMFERKKLEDALVNACFQALIDRHLAFTMQDRANLDYST